MKYSFKDIYRKLEIIMKEMCFSVSSEVNLISRMILFSVEVIINFY